MTLGSDGFRRFARRTLAAAAGAALALPALARSAVAQGFPQRPLRMIVPYPPGGGTDIVGRLLAERMRASLGQPVVVENRPGAAEMVGTEATLRAAPDGHTVGIITSAACIHPAMGVRLPYDLLRDAEPIGLLVRIPHVLVVHPSVRAATVPEFVALLRAEPGRYSYASLGPGSPHGVAMEWFRQLTGTQILQVPYQGVAPAVNAVLSGEVQASLAGITSALPGIQAGRLRAIGVSPAGGVASHPDWPPIGRDVPGFDMVSWYGLVAPAGVDQAIVARLGAAVSAGLAAPEMAGPLGALGAELAGGGPEQMRSLIRRETELWSNVVRASGARVE